MLPLPGQSEENGFELDTENSQILEFDNQFSLNGPLYGVNESLLNTTPLLESSHVNVEPFISAAAVYHNFSEPANVTDTSYNGLHNMIDLGIGAETDNALQLHNTDELEWDMQARLFQATMWILDRNMRQSSSSADITFTSPRMRSNMNEDENSDFTRNRPRDILSSGPSRADSILKRQLVENAPGWEFEYSGDTGDVTFSLKKDNPDTQRRGATKPQPFLSRRDETR